MCSVVIFRLFKDLILCENKEFVTLEVRIVDCFNFLQNK